jgi:uncharacterized membrane protein
VSESAYVNRLVDEFEIWLCQFENQFQLHSVQGGFERWLQRQGFQMIGDDYSTAVGVALTYLSLCVANPRHRYYLNGPDADHNERALLQVKVPEDDTEEQNYWEFLTEENFRRMYAEWKKLNPRR